MPLAFSQTGFVAVVSRGHRIAQWNRGCHPVPLPNEVVGVPVSIDADRFPPSFLPRFLSVSRSREGPREQPYALGDVLPIGVIRKHKDVWDALERGVDPDDAGRPGAGRRHDAPEGRAGVVPGDIDEFVGGIW